MNVPLDWTTRIVLHGLLATVVLGLFCMASEFSRADSPIDFQAEVMPILSDRCFLCHGQDEATREAGLRLDQAEGVDYAFAGGDFDASEAWRRITAHDVDERMPPAEFGKPLSEKEIGVLRRWMQQGSPWEGHWAFERPRRPATPAPSAVGSANPIDAFIVAKLGEKGRSLAQPASRETLIRRLSFDLIGLPPSLEEIDAFVADDQPGAYERLVDRLLASPHYGERMAVDWLDIARYADTNGYQNDFARSMWPWRNWVIDAFNANMPFDQFTVEQLAGDMLPSAAASQRLATGFCRNNRTVTEAGSIEEEWHVENVIDRTETLGIAWLGLTVGCARCHDHKYDPVTQRDFYGLFAFFNSVNEKGVYTEQRGNVPPLMRVATPEQERRLAGLKGVIRRHERAIEQASLDPSAPRQWLQELNARRQQAAKGVGGRSLLPNQFAKPDQGREKPPQNAHNDFLGAVARFSGNETVEIAGFEPPERDRPCSWSIWITAPASGAILSTMANATDFRGMDLLIRDDGRLEAHLIHHWPDNAIKIVTKETPFVKESQPHHVAMTYDGSSQANGLKIYVDGSLCSVDVAVDKLSDSIVTLQPLSIGVRPSAGPLKGDVRDLRYFNRLLSRAEILSVAEEQLAQIDVERLSGDKSIAETIRSWYLVASDEPAALALREAQTALDKTTAELSQYEAELPTAMIMEELPQPRPAYVLKRGQYDLPDKSTVVAPSVPTFLPPLPEGEPANRLTLARWLIDPAHPLTARVAVNRLWRQFFGVGLVKTANDFGLQGERPSHPELLDWLAVELVESAWNVKQLQRLIVTSAAYRQSSQAGPEAYAEDPENRWLARGPRFRLPAELVRDNALRVSGLLATRIGGPSVMPYQPEGLWKELAGAASEEYKQAQGEELYRRSLYVYRKRTVPHPELNSFDAPSWEFCTAGRDRTNTPLQALSLLNNATYVEAARALAARMIADGGASDKERLVFGFRQAAGRRPTPDELDVLIAALKHHRQTFKADAEAAKAWTSTGESSVPEHVDRIELAAYASVASMLLNLDEAISKN